MRTGKKIKKDGFTIIEIIIAIVIIVSVSGVILSFSSFDIRSSEINRTKLQAVLFAREAMEAVRNFRDNTVWFSDGMGVLISGVSYYPVVASSGWNIISGSENTGIFTRSIVFYNVSRDAGDNIETIYNSVNNDPNTKRVMVTVNWNDRYGPASESLEAYLTNWRN